MDFNEVGLDQEQEVNEPNISQTSQDFNTTSEMDFSFFSNSQSSTTSTCGNGYITLKGICSTKASENACIICPNKTRFRIPKSARMDVWKKRQIYIHSSSRTCKDHLDLNIGHFKEDILNQIYSTKLETKVKMEEFVQFVKDITAELLS